MKYTFIDTEGDINQGGGLRTFGFIVTDENFNILEDSRDVWLNTREDKNGETFHRSKYDIRFNRMYCILRDYMTRNIEYVVGFAVQNDVDRINAACERFKTKPLSYKFFDVQMLYKAAFGKDSSLGQCVTDLGIEEEFKYHQSKEDARATMYVMQKLCSKLGLTLPQCIERYADFTGKSEMYMSQLKRDEKIENLHSCLAHGFKIRVDFPLIRFKKNIGPKNNDGKHEGVCYFYDLTLDKLFPDRHPHKAAKVRNDSLIHPRFFAEAKRRGLKMLETEDENFYNSKANLGVQNFFVSYEFMGEITDDGKLIFKHGAKELKTIDRRNNYVSMLNRKGLLSDRLISKYYNAQTFKPSMMKNAKWNYGDKNPEIQVDEGVPFDSVKLGTDDVLYLPRAFEYVLTGKVGDNALIVCKKEHTQFAVAQKTVDIDTLSLPDKSIKLIAVDKEGNAFAYIPCKRNIYCVAFDCTYELPLLICRKIDLKSLNIQ
ncbi:MAG: hypothetical protein K2N14_04280 [Clostridia bacterium]|nr:hypothetical protein [Clostridia bacterium]